MEKIYVTICSLNLRHYFSALLNSEVGGPLPKIKRFKRSDLEKMDGWGVLESGLKENELVVIHQERKLV